MRAPEGIDTRSNGTPRLAGVCRPLGPVLRASRIRPLAATAQPARSTTTTPSAVQATGKRFTDQASGAFQRR